MCGAWCLRPWLHEQHPMTIQIFLPSGDQHGIRFA
jgi:hypothetical protein